MGNFQFHDIWQSGYFNQEYVFNLDFKWQTYMDGVFLSPDAFILIFSYVMLKIGDKDWQQIPKQFLPPGGLLRNTVIVTCVKCVQETSVPSDPWYYPIHTIENLHFLT